MSPGSRQSTPSLSSSSRNAGSRSMRARIGSTGRHLRAAAGRAARRRPCSGSTPPASAPPPATSPAAAPSPCTAVPHGSAWCPQLGTSGGSPFSGRCPYIDFVVRCTSPLRWGFSPLAAGLRRAGHGLSSIPPQHTKGPRRALSTRPQQARYDIQPSDLRLTTLSRMPGCATLAHLSWTDDRDHGSLRACQHVRRAESPSLRGGWCENGNGG